MVVIQVSIDTTEPLTGSAFCEHRGPVPFVGWLQMLRAVSELVGEAAGTDGMGTDVADTGLPAVSVQVGEPQRS
ncbi:MAG: hypothetical protein IT306_02295 [Chloroflexi bacterium]|nr:hypothetical protein [Chloroflexota bacterium]